MADSGRSFDQLTMAPSSNRLPPDSRAATRIIRSWTPALRDYRCFRTHGESKLGKGHQQLADAGTRQWQKN